MAVLSAAHEVPAGEFEARRLRGALPPTCTKGAYTAAARVSYMEGVAHGLYESVREAKKRKELQQQRRLEMAREQASRGEAWQCSDDDDDDDDDDDYGGGHGGGGFGGSDGEDDGDGGGALASAAPGALGCGCGSSSSATDEVKVKLEDDAAVTSQGAGSSSADAAADGDGAARGEVKKEISAADAVVKLEREAKAATALVTHHENIASDFLQQVGVKLSKRKRTYTKSVQRRESFVKGKVDSKDIDINQKSLAGPNQSSSSSKR